jgi:NAD(P)-dependent dehydrogenase (short-subunit alcohol dehydrogenase family)
MDSGGSRPQLACIREESAPALKWRACRKPLQATRVAGRLQRRRSACQPERARNASRGANEQLFSRKVYGMTLKGKTALITGGSSGIGLASAQAFIAHGARVAITGRDADRLARAGALLGPNALTIQSDVRSMADIENMRETVAREFGHLDIFFANAGAGFSNAIATTDEAKYNALMDVNFKGVYFSVQAALTLMQPGASIILNSSWLNEVGTLGTSLLSASKAAVRSLARTLSAELLPRKIRVNAISPGAIDTPMRKGSGASSPEKLKASRERLEAAIPLGRLGTAEEIAEAVLFLASDSSRYMLGAELVVDGGFAQI